MKSEATERESGPKFDAFFSQTFGARWPELKDALYGEPAKFLMKNPFGSEWQDYTLDSASLLPVRLLNPQPGQKVADLCASPGGKSLAAIFALNGEGDWYCNDLSKARVQRLKAVLFDCLPDQVRSRVRVSCGDGSRWGLRFPLEFDRVLVDAPCSGERHLLSKPQELARWSEKGSRRLAVRQHALLCAGIDSAKAGARVVYSTCSLSRIENDGVIERILKSRRGRVEVVTIEDSEVGEPTEYGRIVLPDRAAGAGPIYACALLKCAD